MKSSERTETISVCSQTLIRSVSSSPGHHKGFRSHFIADPSYPTEIFSPLIYRSRMHTDMLQRKTKGAQAMCFRNLAAFAGISYTNTINLCCTQTSAYYKYKAHVFVTLL